MKDYEAALQKLDESDARIVLMLNVPMCFSTRHDLSQDLQETMFEFLNELGLAFDYTPFLDKQDTEDGPYDSVDPDDPESHFDDSEEDEDISWEDFSDHIMELVSARKLPYQFVGVADFPVPHGIEKDSEGNIVSYSSAGFGIYRPMLIKGNNMSEMADCIIELEKQLLEEVWIKEQSEKSE